MYSIDIKNNKEIYEYCMHNGITDINKFVQDCFKQGYDIKKYGLLGKTLNEGEKDLIKEVIVEKQVEIPVEVIKEVEKIIEVIKEVPIETVVTKIEYISDKSGENELFGKIEQLENEMSKKDEELDKLRRSLDISVDENKVSMLQQTIVTLNNEIRILKTKNKELENKLLEQPKESDFTRARFHGSSNLNDGLYK